MIIHGDAKESLQNMVLSDSIDCCVTSPPYFNLRDYGIDGQIGMEDTPQEYINRLLEVFHEVKRVLKNEGTLWVNIGDSYNGSGHGFGSEPSGKQTANNGSSGHLPAWVNGVPNKSLIGIPWRFAFAMIDDGWTLRNDIIWHKNPMPDPAKDRFARSHEHLFFFVKNRSYYFDHNEALEESEYQDGRNFHHSGSGKYKGIYGVSGNGRIQSRAHRMYVEVDGKQMRNKRDVWYVPTEPCKEAHYAMYPTKLITPCIKCGCPVGGIVLDPFFGGGTTGVVALRYGRKYLGVELNGEYIEIAKRRIKQESDKTALYNLD